MWRLLLRLLELVTQGENLADASVPAGRCHGLPVKGNILLDGGIDQAAVFRLGHGHVALCHDLIQAALHLLPLRGLFAVLLLQRQVDAGAGRKQRWWWLKTCPVYLKAPEMSSKTENSLIKRVATVENTTLCDNQQAALHFPPCGVTFNMPRLSLRCHQSLTAVFICVPAARMLTGCLTSLKNNKTRLFSLSDNPFFLLHLVHKISNAMKKRSTALISLKLMF